MPVLFFIDQALAIRCSCLPFPSSAVVFWANGWTMPLFRVLADAARFVPQCRSPPCTTTPCLSGPTSQPAFFSSQSNPPSPPKPGVEYDLAFFSFLSSNHISVSFFFRDSPDMKAVLPMRTLVGVPLPTAFPRSPLQRPPKAFNRIGVSFHVCFASPALFQRSFFII